MKLRNLIFAALTMVFAIACENNKEDLGLPKIDLGTEELVFDMAGGEQNVTFVATRDWMVENNAAWIAVSPASGSASTKEQTISVTVLENTKMDREADVVITIGMSSRSFKVKQSGPGGSAEALIVYANDFDKEKAVKDDSGWKTYLDSFDGWKNATGTAAETVTYAFSGMSARTSESGHSAGSYSDYEGSGMNYLWFGSGTPFFSVKNIVLPNAANYLLSFGAERNLYQAEDNTFSTEEFKVWISLDDKKWVELKYEFPGAAPNRRWDLATSNFSLPAGTSKISLTFQCTLASSVLFDDLKLMIAETAGSSIDFSKAVEKDFGTGGSTGGDEPTNIIDVTVAQFNEKPVSTTEWYRIKGTVGGPINTTYGNFDIIDETGKVYVYGISNWSEFKSKVAEGGSIVVVGQRGEYNGKIEVLKGKIESYEGSGTENPGGDEPTNIIDVTVAQFNEKPVSTTEWYRIKGTVGGPINTTYGNFDIIDETGKVYVYGISNWSEFKSKVVEGGSIVVVGNRGEYNGKIEVLKGYIESYDGQGAENPGGGDDPVEETGEYDPQGITWTLGANAYDNTSGGNAIQTAVVNGVKVNNLLKLGAGSKVGDATIHIPAGTAKVSFYAMSWTKTTAQVKITMGGNSMTINPPANAGATGNPPYTITLAEDKSDYFEIDVPVSDAVDVKVETVDIGAPRVIFIGLKAIAR
ncbi:MAG: BACON domain-containing protein [Candidatus Cryptobacteroides sp.]